MAEIRKLGRTKFPESIQVASLSIKEEPMLIGVNHLAQVAELAVPWGVKEDGGVNEHVWKFLGPKVPIAGTLVIVEDLPDGSMKFVGSTEEFYEVSMQ